MPYVHLANGDVLDLSDQEWADAQKESNTPSAFHRDGLQYTVIGVFPKEVEHPLNAEQQAAKDAKDNEDRAAFEKWQHDNKRDDSAPAATAFDGSPL